MTGSAASDDVPRPRSDGLRALLIPPTWFALYIAAMLALHALWPLAQVVHGGWRGTGLPLVIAGFVFVVASRIRFARAGTSVQLFERSEVLVTRGFFRISRNPMYTGMALNLLGLGLLLGSASALCLVPLFVLHLKRSFVVHEERALEARFGGDYRAYKARVRRWLGPPAH